MTPPAPIRVEGLSHFYGKGELKKQILFDVSTEVHTGEIVIVTGPSGSGKTTLLTLVGALRSAHAGSVRILGQELRDARPAVLEQVRRQIGFIFQQYNLLNALTALQNVELGVRASRKFRRSQVRAQAKHMLEAVGLQDRMHYKPEKLSGGQRQRVAIARALASRPAMILADEPTASLDSRSGREVVDAMKALAQDEGATILLVTHDNRILDIADRILHLEDGRLSTFTDEVIANNSHMMRMLAHNRHKQSVDGLIDDLDEQGFYDLLLGITEESRRFLESTALAQNVAFRSLLEQGLFAFTRKLGSLLNAERSSLFLVEDGTLVLTVAEHLDEMGEVRIPLGTGIAGAVARTGKALRIDDAYEDPRFNREVDARTGFRTRSILSLPVTNRDGEVFAVAQLLNRKDGRPFDEGDEKSYAEFMRSIALILETLQGLKNAGAPPERSP